MESARRRPGRPPSFDRDHVLDRAMRVFWAHGYDAASLALLQVATGLTPPSIYHAFGSKAGLYAACLDHYADRIARRTNESLIAGTPGRDGLRRFLVAAARQFTDPAGPPGCMVSTAAPHPAEVAAAVTARRAAMLDLTTGYLSRAGAPDPATLARFFGAVVQGMSVQARDGATTAELEAVAETALAAWPS